MYSPLYKRILILLSCLSLVVTVVTYRPYKSEAAAGVVVQFAAKQAARALVKSSINKTIGSLALKEATKEVSETFVKKEGFKLIVLDGGKKEMIKTALTTTEKELLKKNIDKVIEMKIYGNSPKWVKFVDWFLGIGTLVLAVDVLVSVLSGGASEFLNEIFIEAMRMSDLLIQATPSFTPIGSTVTTPVSQYNPGTISDPFQLDYKKMYEIAVNHNIYRSNYATSSIGYTHQTTIGLSEPVPELSGMTYYVEASGIYNVPNIFQTLSIGGLQLHAKDNSTQYSSELPAGFSRSYSSMSSYINGVFNATVSSLPSSATDRYLWSTLVGSEFLANAYNSSSVQPTLMMMDYNRFIYTTPKVEGTNVNAYLKMTSTYRDLPEIVIKYTTPVSRYVWQNISTSSLIVKYAAIIPMLTNQIKMRIGIFSSLEYLPELPLPVPSVNQYPNIKPDLLQLDNKVYIPNKTILPEGYTYNPQTQTITDPVGNDVPDPSVIPDKVPDPVVVTDPEGNPVIDDVPVPKPDPEPVPEPDPADPDDPTPDPSKPEDIQWKKLKTIPTIFTTKFPFSLPWDIERFMSSLFGSVPTVASLKWEIPPLMGIDPDITITIPKYFDQWFAFGRTTVLVMFDISLVYAIYRLLGGAS